MRIIWHTAGCASPCTPIAMDTGAMKQKQKPQGTKREVLFSVTLADCDLQTFSAGGPGGQHQNTSNTAVRIVHKDSGAKGESREHRSQLQNKKAAWKRMTEDPKFKVWVNRMIFHAGISPEEKVKKDMMPDNLKVEIKEDGKWVPVEDEIFTSN